MFDVDDQRLGGKQDIFAHKIGLAPIRPDPGDLNFDNRHSRIVGELDAMLEGRGRRPCRGLQQANDRARDKRGVPDPGHFLLLG
jgi:hypothetical protein